MVLAVVSGSGSFSRWLGWRGWRPVATGSYTLYLTHMMAIPVAQVLADVAVVGRHVADGPMAGVSAVVSGGICLRGICAAQTRRKACTQLAG